MLRAAAAISMGGVAAGIAGHAKIKEELGEEALDRIASFYAVSVPMIIEYKILEAKCEILPQYVPSIFPQVSLEEERKLFDPLHHKWSPLIVAKFMELGGFYYKNGQRGAGNMGGFVPKIWQDAMQPFLDQIPPRDFESCIRPAIEESLGGRPLDEVFSSIDPSPLGTASIGQVRYPTPRPPCGN